MRKIIYIIIVLIHFTAFSQERYTVKLASFNSKVSDFGTAYMPNGDLIFASERDSGTVANRRHKINGKLRPYLQLFSVSKNDPTKVSKLTKVVNKKYHESTVAVTNDGKTMYFTRNNFFKKKYKEDSNKVNLLKLFKVSKGKDGEWGEITELPFNDDEYSVAHPALNAENTRLYFASNMPGTIGKSDIWYVNINEDQSYGNPVNMGGTINTEGSDTFPFMAKSGDLYFSSDKHNSKGGLDIFVVKKIEKYKKIYNLGSPVNTTADDFAFIFNEEDKTGYISSNRKNGVGDDDIYKLKELKPLIVQCNGIISGVVNDDKEIALPYTKVVLTNSKGEEIATTSSDANGNYKFTIDCKNKTYTVTGTKKNYKKDQKKVATSFKNKQVEVNLKLEEIMIGVDLVKRLNLKPIYFDSGKSFIREDAGIELQKVIDYMKNYPNIKIEVRSHTDSKSRDAYNLKLSEKRAKATVKYITEVGGISVDRVSGKGFGETKLLNECSNGVKCSKEKHQLNRRSEFIVVE